MMYRCLWIIIFNCCHSLATSVIDLTNIESRELINVRKYAGFCLSTVMITVMGELRINRIVDGYVPIWQGMLTERLIECWLYGKADKQLMLDLYVIDDDGTRRDYFYILCHGTWTSVNFVQYHQLLRDLRLNSKSLAEIQYGQIVRDDYDPYREFNEIIYRNRSHNDQNEEPSLIQRICCDIVTCFL